MINSTFWHESQNLLLRYLDTLKFTRSNQATIISASLVYSGMALHAHQASVHIIDCFECLVHLHGNPFKFLRMHTDLSTLDRPRFETTCLRDFHQHRAQTNFLNYRD